MNNSASMPRFRQINSHCCTVCLKIRFSTCHHHRNILKMGADRKHRLCQKHIRHIVETKQPPSWVGISRPTLAGVLMISSHHWSHHQPHHQHTTRLLMTIGPLDEPTAHWSPRQQQESGSLIVVVVPDEGKEIKKLQHSQDLVHVELQDSKLPEKVEKNKQTKQ